MALLKDVGSDTMESSADVSDLAEEQSSSAKAILFP